jgi:hypothetical protein
MYTKRFIPVVIALFTAVLLLVPNAAVFAHGSTTVGDYTIVIGFKNEPAIQGEMNGLDLIVTNSKTGQPVTGLEETLEAEIIFGASKKTLEIEPVFGEDGAYTAAVMPTREGDYTYHIFGKIEDTPVDISMTSSPSTFGSVESPSEVAFPGIAPATTTLAAGVAQANQMATIGIAVGALGVLLGLAGLGVALSRGRRAEKKPLAGETETVQ